MNTARNPSQPNPPSSGQNAAPSQESQAGGAFDSALPQLPSLSLPKGGGAIHGMGEKFMVNSSNGTGSTTLPITASQAKGGIQPALTLTYSSGAGNGVFGLGWHLSRPSITRKTEKGLPQYNDAGSDADADVFLLSDAEDLVPIFKRDSLGNLAKASDGTPVVDEMTKNGYRIRRYAPRIESTYQRIERWTSVADVSDIHWRVLSGQNHTTIFGSSRSSRICDPNAGPGEIQRTFAWLVAETYDSLGNAMIFNYKAEDSTNVPTWQANEANRTELTRSANRYLKSIQYGNAIPNRQADSWAPTSAFDLAQSTWKFSVVFDYGEHDAVNPKPNDAGSWACRQDPFSDYHSCFEVRTYRLCQRILMFHHFAELGTSDYLVGSTDLSYDQSGTVTYLTMAAKSGYVLATNGTSYLKQSLPPVTYEYSRFPSDEKLSQLVFQEVDESFMANLPTGLALSNYQWLDLKGEGISGVLTEQGGAWFYSGNSSTTNVTDTGALQARFDSPEILPTRPSASANSETSHFADVSGAGNVDMVVVSGGAWGYFERTEEGDWTSLQTFTTFPNVDTKNKDMKMVDLTGDGLADILICADQIYTWYPSLGADGYGGGHTVTQPSNERNGPISVFADTEQTVYLADMSGDGLTDIVRVRNNDICYWPNCGYGRFGAMIRMDNAPCFDSSDQFDQKRIRLADIDGSGTTDILYLGSLGVDIYLNQSGNGFASRKRLVSFIFDDLSVVNTLDLLGTGTSCLVWSSALPSAQLSPMRYVDIMQGKKAHLITKVVNNLGSETVIQYSPSTKFFLQDKQDGHPWLTRLPFPVQCVETLETLDRISGNRFTSKYCYHHGFFDGLEREFRGFAMVEQWDTDDFASMNKVDSTNVHSSWHVPPIHTKTWFHTGVYINGGTISRQLASDYFGASLSGSPEEFYSMLLDDTVLPDQLDGVQQREACRSLKGHTLRIEVYADDNSPKAGIPYSVQEGNFTIVVLQPNQDAHLHGIYAVNPRESVSYQLERNISDPRVQHDLVLQTDLLGNVQKSLKVAYGRQPGLSSLSGSDKVKQETTLAVYSEYDFTNIVDSEHDYRLPMPSETRQYEISGLKTGSNNRYNLDILAADNFSTFFSMQEIPFESQSSGLTAQKRIIVRSRIMYRKDDLTGILPVGQVQSLGLFGLVYDMAFTPGLITGVFKRLQANGTTENLLPDPTRVLGGIGEQQAGYVDLDNNGGWWKKSGSISYSTDPSASALQELSIAKTSFFTPRSFIDPFNNASTLVYDSYGMFPVLITDSVGNSTASVIDYRALQASTVTSPNGNRSTVAFDALRLVVGSALMGKTTENIGDNLSNFNADLSQAEIDSFFQSPTPSAAAALLGGATERVIYDVGRYWRQNSETMPTYTAAISRETHFSDLGPGETPKVQIMFSYSDGLGRAIQVRNLTKAGPITDQGLAVSNRWMVSGWTVFNNKGKPVKQYESFYDDSHDFKNDSKVGVTPILMYDPLMRVVATLRPDHALEKAIFDPWSATSFDANDNVLISNPKNDPDIGHFFDELPEYEYLPSWYDSRINGQAGPDEKSAAIKSAAHSNTPRVSHNDALGRVILAIDDDASGGLISTRTTFDIKGNQRETSDALNRSMTKIDYDIVGSPIHRNSIDAGELWLLNDVLNKELYRWDSRGFGFRSKYDGNRRLIESWMQLGTSDAVAFEQTVYGELSPDPLSHNLRGNVWQVKDQAGVVTNSYDFKSNVLVTERQLAVNYKGVIDLSMNPPLESKTYVTEITYDALNRPIQSTAPDKSVTFRMYNQSTHLDKSFVNVGAEQSATDPSSWTAVVTNADYNARNQLVAISYGNGTSTARTYDHYMSRLQRIQTSQPGKVLQDLNYTYDPVGNITNIQDHAQQAIFFRNARVDPVNDYVYDAIYRLVTASGREHLGQINGASTSPSAPGAFDSPNNGELSPGDGNAMGTYTESYKYDAVGNILSISHAGNDPKFPGWTRTYAYNEGSPLEPGKQNNRLSYTEVGSVTESYSYDPHGNITKMPHLSMMQWDFKNQLSATSQQIVSNGGTPEITYYVYDSSGLRVRKITESQSGTGSSQVPKKLKERIYLPGFEYFHKFDANSQDIALERVTLPVSSDLGHVANIETRTIGTDDGLQRLIRYQLDNLSGSSCVELDDQARIISYEEYFPFGSTSYQAMASQTDVPKRYRHTGKERDEESGLYYHGARYYASWLGRWTSTDPIDSGKDPYAYVLNNPVRFSDPDGKEESDEVELPHWVQDLTGPQGSLAHEIVLPELSRRLAERGAPNQYEMKTLPGGSKSGKGRGEIDTVIYTPGANGTFTAHVYDLKPFNLDPAYYNQHKPQVQRYVDKFDKKGSGVDAQAKVGTALEVLERMDALKPPEERLLAPVIRYAMHGGVLYEIKISLTLPRDASGHVIDGFLAYTISYKVKRRPEDDKRRMQRQIALMQVNMNATVGSQTLHGIRFGQMLVGGAAATAAALPLVALAAPEVAVGGGGVLLAEGAGTAAVVAEGASTAAVVAEGAGTATAVAEGGGAAAAAGAEGAGATIIQFPVRAATTVLSQGTRAAAVFLGWFGFKNKK